RITGNCRFSRDDGRGKVATMKKGWACFFGMMLALMSMGAEPVTPKDAGKAGMRFAMKMYSTVKGDGGNVVVSPVCVSTGMMVAAMGGDQQARVEAMRALGWKEEKLDGADQAWAGLVAQIRDKKSAEEGIEGDVNAAVWVRTGTGLKTAFA